ncbi:MAG: YbhB/YbcL family Raf kinase inhibitor-like protein [Hyphomonadaceae bacterium]
MKTYISASVLAIAMAGPMTACTSAPDMPMDGKSSVVAPPAVIATPTPVAPPASVIAESPPPLAVEVGKEMLASITLPASNVQKMAVSTPGWPDGGDIDFKYTQYETNTFPGLTWTAGPAATKSYAVIMQDTDLVMRGSPILHWSVVNIPASVTKLAPGMAPEEIPAGSIYGPNYKGMTQPYLGPRTPAGPKHRYHIQVLALDTVLAADFAPKNYAELIEPLKGHVIGVGDVVGLGQEKK